MIDLGRSYFNRVDELPVKTGNVVNVEGAALVGELASGEEVALLSNGSGTFIGVSLATTITPTIATNVETAVIPSAPGPYTINLEKQNIYSASGEGVNTGEILIVGATTGAFANDTSSGLPPGTGEYHIVYATGVVTFNVAQAGEAITITYRYSPTQAEAITEFYQGHVNNYAHTYFNRISVAKAPMRIYTDQYVASVQWSTITAGNVHQIAGGLFSGSGGVQIANCRVIHVPTEDNPFLGLQFE